MGLDRDDTIIRRRLRQKLEFLVEDAAAASAPTDAELQAWLDAHPESFRAEPQLAFRQVYVSPSAAARARQADAEKLLARLRTAGPGRGHRPPRRRRRCCRPSCRSQPLREVERVPSGRTSRRP